MKSKLEILDKQHWQYEDYRQRIVTKDWRDILLNFDDHVIFKGRVRKLLSENKGAGVIEVWKEPLPAKRGRKMKQITEDKSER